MTSIRKFAYTALLAVSTLGIAPNLAVAQTTAHGQFKLTHDVRWQNAVVPAGAYRFSLDEHGPSGLLMLTKLDSPRTGFLLSVLEIDETRATEVSQLLLESTAKGSYVSAMELPEFGMTLRFAVPAAPVATTVMASGK